MARTNFRHVGQVYGLPREDEFCAAWTGNHSFKQQPQNVWRQSRSVSGWYRVSVQMAQFNSFSRFTVPGITTSAMAACASWWIQRLSINHLSVRHEDGRIFEVGMFN